MALVYKTVDWRNVIKTQDRGKGLRTNGETIMIPEHGRRLKGDEKDLHALRQKRADEERAVFGSGLSAGSPSDT